MKYSEPLCWQPLSVVVSLRRNQAGQGPSGRELGRSVVEPLAAEHFHSVATLFFGFIEGIIGLRYQYFFVAWFVGRERRDT